MPISRSSEIQLIILSGYRIFSFLLDKIDTGFELSVTTPLMIGHLQMTIGVPDTLESSNDKFLTYWAVLYLFTTQGVELMWSQIAHNNFIPHD